MTTYSNIDDFFGDISNRFDPDLTRGIDASIQLDLTGDSGSTWGLTVKDRKLSVTQGALDNPDVTMTLSAADWLDIVNGVTQPTALFMQGQMQIDGDMSIAIEMASWFNLG